MKSEKHSPRSENLSLSQKQEMSESSSSDSDEDSESSEEGNKFYHMPIRRSRTEIHLRTTKKEFQMLAEEKLSGHLDFLIEKNSNTPKKKPAK
jgi:hypothetical protein